MKILMIVDCFAPKNVIGAVRTSKLAKYLVRAGNELTVVSPVLEDYDKRDETLECVEFDNIRRITVPYSKLTTLLTRRHKGSEKRNGRIAVQNQLDRSAKAKLYKALRNSFAWWRDYEWTKKVNRIIDAEDIIYDVVISSYPDASTHDAAYHARKCRKASRWIADFRDPMVIEKSFDNRRKKLVKRQSDIVKHADLVTHVSRTGVERFTCYPEDKHKVIWIPNGFDEDDFDLLLTLDEPVQSAKALTLSYAGGLYGGERDCSPLFQAMKELRASGELAKDSVILNYAGKDGDILRQQAEKYGVCDVINDMGQITRTQSIQMQLSSDCVIVATWCYTDHGGPVTGKIYEPIMMRKPILMLVRGAGKNSEPGSFIKELNAGVVYEESADHGDVTVIKKMLSSMLKEKTENGRVESKMNEEKRGEYSHRCIVDKLLNEIEKIL